MVRKKILHYHQLYINRSDPIVFMSLPVDTSGRIYDDFNRLLFPHVHRETSTLTNEISGQFRFLHAACLVNIKGSVGLILVKTSVMRISIPLDLCTTSRAVCTLRNFTCSMYPFVCIIYLSGMIGSTFLFTNFTVHHCFSVTLNPPTLVFFILSW